MAKLKIYKGKEFKVYVTDNIQEDDLFFVEYRKAAEMLSEIVKYDRKNDNRLKVEYENNIIAFCGERGEGKSSVMLSFVETMRSNSKKSQKVFEDFNGIENVHFSEPIIVDPSLFDGTHGILDVVLAKIYNEVDCIKKSNQMDKLNEYEKIIAQFQKVYKYVLLINNQKKTLDDEYDYEGDIGRLVRLGDSTNLKSELSALIDMYLKFEMCDKSAMEKNKLVIAIDDLDLCSNKVYQMTEEIRKYLILPNVIIVMALRIEQLEDCICEKNARDYTVSIDRFNDNNRLKNDIIIMSEKYVNKLIPKARRIYLPRIGSFQELAVKYIDDRNGEEKIFWETEKQQDVIAAMRKLIYEKTGIILLPKEMGKNILFSDNLREMVNLMVFLLKMPDADAGSERQYQNIVELEEYFEREWEHNTVLIQDREEFEALKCADIDSVNDEALWFIQKSFYEVQNRKDPILANYYTEINNKFTLIIGWFNTVDFGLSDVYRKARIYCVKVFYTFMIHKMLSRDMSKDLIKLIGGYIWCGSFTSILPSVKETNIDRSRFLIKTQDIYNKIIQYLDNDAVHIELTYGKNNSISVPNIPKGDKREIYIWAWILTALFANNYYTNNYQLTFITNGTIVWGNSNTHECVHVSLENYIVALFNIDSILEKVNFEALGAGSEIKNYVEMIKDCNKESIQFMREVISNLDIVTSILDYCRSNADVKSGSEDETNRTEKLVRKFFENMIKYMEQYGVQCDVLSLTDFSLSKDKKINVCKLYAILTDIAKTYEETTNKVNREGERLMLEFREKLRVTPLPEQWDTHSQKASSYLKTATAANAKKNLEYLAANIQRYIGENKKEPYGLNTEALCDLYGKVLKLYLSNENEQIPDELRNDYKQMAAIQSKL
ncbi:MAG: hypothetical protein HFJ03_04480 [Lachnospira sp.]|nr:hypothetical protein [Lachnospira sp.]